MQYMLTDYAKELKETHGIDATPVRGTEHSACWDLKFIQLKTLDVLSVGDCLHIYPGQVIKVGTGIKLNLMPYVTLGYKPTVMIYPRSSSNGLVLENTVGIVDADYQGEIFLKLKNTTENIIKIALGERVAQMLLVMVPCIQTFEEVDVFNELTERGEGGDGSTGKLDAPKNSN